MNLLYKILAVGMAVALFVGAEHPVAPDLIAAPWDKLVHAGYFFVLTLAAAQGFGGRPVWVVALVLLVGLADEWHQFYLPARVASLGDWVADLAGVVLAVGIRGRFPFFNRGQRPLYYAYAIQSTDGRERMKQGLGRMPVAVRWTLMAAVASVVVWRALSVNMADYFAREPETDAATALKWDSRHPQALLAQGVSSTARDAGNASGDLQAAVRQNPASGPGYAALAQIKEKQGDLAAAERAMETAAAMAPRRIDVQTEVATFWMRRGNIERAMQHWNVVLTFGLDLRAQLFPAILQIAENPATLAAFAPLLLQPVEWWPEFFTYAAANAQRLDTIHALYNLQAKGPNTATAPALRSYLERLQREGHWTDAYFTWLNSLPKAQINTVGNLFNGGFEYPISSVGFDWVSDPAGQVLVETAATHGSTGSRALHVVFRGSRVAYRHLRQHLLLPPGSYNLRGRVRPEGLETTHGLQWAVQCVSGKAPLAASERFIGSDQWRHFSFQFIVPAADCPVQVVRLELAGRATLDFEARGGIWFDDLSIERQALD